MIAAAAVVGAAAPAAADDDESIRSFDVRLAVQSDGDLVVTERIAYDFGGNDRHGIERSIPTRRAHDQTHDRVYPVSGVRVTSPSGAPADVEVNEDGDATVLRIGDRDEKVTGRQTYDLTYRVDAVVDPSTNGSVLRWNVIGTGWNVPIDHASVSVTGPAAPTATACVAGRAGSTVACSGDLRDGVTAAGLTAHEGITVAATFPPGSLRPAAPVLDETFSFPHAFQVGGVRAPVALALLALLGWPLVLLRRRTRRHPAPIDPSPQRTPPDDLPPALLAFLVNGASGDEAVPATLLDLAARGVLQIEEVGSLAGTGPDWLVTRLTSGGDDLAWFESLVLRDLFGHGDTTVHLRGLHERAPHLAHRVKAAVRDDAVERGWFSVDPHRVHTRWALLGLGATAVASVVTVSLAVLTTYAVLGVPLLAAAVALFALGVRVDVRTAAGEALLERTIAFRQHLRETGDLGPDGRCAGHALALGVRATAVAGSNAPSWYAGDPHATYPAAWVGIWAFSDTTSSSLSPPPSAGSSGSVGSAGGGGGGGSW